MSWNPPGVDGWAPGMPIPVTDALGNIVGWVSDSLEDQITWCLAWILLIALIVIVSLPIIGIYNAIVYAWRRKFGTALLYLCIPLFYVGVYSANLVYEYVKDDLLCRQVQVWADVDEQTVYIKATPGTKHVGIRLNGRIDHELSIYRRRGEIIGYKFDVEFDQVYYQYVWKYDNSSPLTSAIHYEDCLIPIVEFGQEVVSPP